MKLDSRLKAVTTVHISGGFACNDDCLFCTDKGPDVPKKLPRPRKEDIKKIIRDNAEIGIIDFSTLEVSLNPDLPELIAYCREQGYHTISISTNGRALPRKNLIQRLLDNGLNRFHISIHGHTAEIHNRITQRKGSFEESIAGLEAICEAREQHPYLEIFAHSTICKLNYEALPEMVPFFLSYEPAHYGLNSLQYQGAVERDDRGDLVAVPYPDVIAKLKEALPRRPKLNVSISELPLCVLIDDIPVHYFGVREDYRIAMRDSQGITAPVAIAPGREFSHGPPCFKCVYRSVCEGAWNGYVQRYGWDHFRPLNHEDLDRLHFESDAAIRRLLEAPGPVWSIEGIHRTYDEAIIEVSSPQLPEPFRIQLSERDDDAPAFRRTRQYNISIRGKDTTKMHEFLVDAMTKLILRRESEPRQPEAVSSAV